MSIELPSDAASASQSGKHWLFRPSTDEAYTNDAMSIELPSDATKLLRPALQNDFNRSSAGKVQLCGLCGPSLSVDSSQSTPSSTSRAHPSDAVSCSRQRSGVSPPDRAYQITLLLVHRLVGPIFPALRAAPVGGSTGPRSDNPNTLLLLLSVGRAHRPDAASCSRQETV